jgi:hypothetical protein
MRRFDPRAVGALECRAWETYYRRRWLRCLITFIALVRTAFGMSVPRTLRGAWLVLRANQKWAPHPRNDPAAARALMTRFYEVVKESEGEPSDPARAAWLEVEWWRAHRAAQHSGRVPDQVALVDALTNLYEYTYSSDRDAVRPAAKLRADAMVLSDRWVAAGCDPQDPLLRDERVLLVRSYAALLAAVHR